MEHLIGEVINNFELQKIVGQGGMGVVFRAYHPDLQNYAAVKVMNPALVQQADSYERFLQEARTAARLEHPNIVRVSNFGRLADTYYIMMDYIEGISLRQFIQENEEGLVLEDVLHIFIQIADVLAFAHAEDVLHRDLKPDNILITDSTDADIPYRAVVTDFGLVKIASQDSLAQTQEGVSLGTPAYMSPEQCRGQEVDARSDIFAMGIMLYEALTGKRPYPIRNLFDAIKFHSSEKIPSPRAHVPSLDRKLNALVRRMMSPHPDKRPATAKEVATRLRTFLPQTAAPSTDSSQVLQRLVTDQHKLPDAPTTQLDSNRDTEGALPQEQLCVLVTYKGNIEKIYPIPLSGQELVVGRQQGSDIMLDSPERYVSKRHCAINQEDDEVYVRDLNSTNGTFLGSLKLTPLEPYRWKRDTEINLGAFKLSLQLQSYTDRALAASVAEAEETVVQGRFVLVCAEGVPAQLPLGSTPVIIGRVPGCDMVLSNSRVSKRHCRIERKGNVITVTDLNSTNGTYMGNQRLPVNNAIEWNGEPLRIGSFILRLDQ